MKLLNTIKNHETLGKYVKDECEQNNIFASITEEFDEDDYLILKVTEYYEALRLPQIPATPDCFFVIHCGEEVYSIVIVELKAGGFKIGKTWRKFRTCFTDYMIEQFPEYFNRDFKSIDLLAVGDIESHSRYKNQMLEQRFKILKERSSLLFRDDKYEIQFMQSPHTIIPCTEA